MKEKVLVAISDNVLSTILVQKLKQDGYRPRHTHDGKETLEVMRSFLPDLVVIDIILSGINGYDVLHEKSYDREITKIPVIIVSNSGIPVEMNRIPSTPMIKDYIIKAHVEPDEVMEKVEKAFGRTYTPHQEGEIVNKANGKKILWVEDDKFLSMILSKKFEGSGYTLLKAKDSTEAFSLLASDIPDIIILDILLPGVSGFEILQKIKEDEKLKNIPVIMLSNMSKQSDIEKSKTLGAQRFIVKAAVSLDEIITEVESLIA